jgi:hypothetical protein
MKIVYRAENILEAHIVAGMLTASGIEAYTSGHYLQGAIGDLSPSGFANVMVGDENFDDAVTIVKEYEQNRSRSEAEETENAGVADNEFPEWLKA